MKIKDIFKDGHKMGNKSSSKQDFTLKDWVYLAYVVASGFK